MTDILKNINEGVIGFFTALTLVILALYITYKNKNYKVYFILSFVVFSCSFFPLDALKSDTGIPAVLSLYLILASLYYRAYFGDYSEFTFFKNIDYKHVYYIRFLIVFSVLFLLIHPFYMAIIIAFVVDFLWGILYRDKEFLEEYKNKVKVKQSEDLQKNYFTKQLMESPLANLKCKDRDFIFDISKVMLITSGIDINIAIRCLKILFDLLPQNKYLIYSGNGMAWGDYIDEAYAKKENKEKLDSVFIYLGEYNINQLKKLKFSLEIPDELRTSHHWIVAGSGAGKTQLFQQMIWQDIEADCSIVVIDSQGDIINKLATRIDLDYLILIDPENCPPALNLFQNRTSEAEIATAIEFYEYIFSSLDTAMTTKQATAYRFISRLLMTIPNATIHTMLEVLEDGGAIKYQSYIDQLGATSQSFFTEYNKPKQSEYLETKRQIKNRLYTVLENKTFEKMLGATESKLNIEEAVNDGKIILINTAKGFLKQTSSSLLGRIFIAQIMQAVMSRKEKRKRTYLYIDEFQDFAEDSHVLFTLFEQARKYNLGLIVAHQYIGQLPTQLQQSIASNTAIKFAKNLSPQDERTMTGHMHTTTERIHQQAKQDFIAWYQGHGVSSYSVEFGLLEKQPEVNKLPGIHKIMESRYGFTPPPPPKSEEKEDDEIERDVW